MTTLQTVLQPILHVQMAITRITDLILNLESMDDDLQDANIMIPGFQDAVQRTKEQLILLLHAFQFRLCLLMFQVYAHFRAPLPLPFDLDP